MMEKFFNRCYASQRSSQFEGELLEYWANNCEIMSLSLFLMVDESKAFCFSRGVIFR